MIFCYAGRIFVNHIEHWPCQPKLNEVERRLVGEAGLEPATSRSQSARASQLRYTPKNK